METMQYSVKANCEMYGGGFARRNMGKRLVDPWDAAPVAYDVEQAFEAVRAFLDVQKRDVSPDTEDATTSMFYTLVATICADMDALIAIYKSIKRHNRLSVKRGRYADMVLFDGLTRREQYGIRRAARKVWNFAYD